MKKDLPPLIISFMAIIIIAHGMVPLTNLLIAGVVPGTSFVLPSWVMIVFYCFAITAVITMYIEGVFSNSKENKLIKKRKNQLPHRRYNEI